MTRIENVFRDRARKALIAYVTVGYPSVEATLSAVPALVAAGCDMIELGIPFSDPLADGATIQEASARALGNGVTPQVCLDVAARLRQAVSVPLLFMTYYNPVLQFGLACFCEVAAGAGVDGLIVPDLPPEESGELEEAARRHGLEVVFLLSPASTPARIRLVVEKSGGFIYLVSLMGVTGARRHLPPGLEAFVRRVRSFTGKPLCVGFGISGPEQARRAGQVADGIIVGSRIVELLAAGSPPYPRVTALVAALRQALDRCTA